MTMQDEVFDLALDTGKQKGDYGVSFDELPEQRRTPPPGREPFQWDIALEPIRQKRGEWAYFVVFPGTESGHSQANAKAQTVRKQLVTARPHEHWEIKSRNRDDEWRIYARYNGLLTQEQQDERARLHKVRSDAIKARIKAKGA